MDVWILWWVLFGLQFIIVPIIAKLKGQSAGIWFLVTLIWELLTFGVGWILVGALTLVALGGGSVDKVTIGLVFTGFAFLPIIVILCTGSKIQGRPFFRRPRHLRHLRPPPPPAANR